MNEKVLEDFWRIIEQFPNIHNLRDLTKVILAIESGNDDTTEIYPGALSFLKEFESIMRSNIYLEWHVPNDRYNIHYADEDWS